MRDRGKRGTFLDKTSGSQVKLRRFKTEGILEEFRFFKQNPGVVRGISTGFSILDYVTGGLKRNELILLAARPGVGKSMLALNIANNAVGQGYTVAFFSQEMSEEQLLWRLASMRSGIPQSAIQHGFSFNDYGERVPLSDEDYEKYEEAIADVATWNIGVYVGGVTTDDMRDAIINAKLEVNLAITDHIGLHTDFAGGSQYQRMTYVSRSLKDMKLEFGIPIIAVAQLNRAVEQREDKRPQLSDLRDSGSLEQDADQVWALWRPDYYDAEERHKPVAKVELEVLKNRNGMTDTVYLQFNKSTGRFFERVEDLAPETADDFSGPSKEEIEIRNMLLKQFGAGGYPVPGEGAA